eukprot:TRINITY_DN4954_c0_g1_i1.p1 TRINITY_DN4954_c0_g1~~TRINITY_DN4954_c0_g1_i1.p1  ORF type:complete len:163 (-),score=27.26 TRINITY_DN4954_c0_g1_i1:212-700(-)
MDYSRNLMRMSTDRKRIVKHVPQKQREDEDYDLIVNNKAQQSIPGRRVLTMPNAESQQADPRPGKRILQNQTNAPSPIVAVPQQEDPTCRPRSSYRHKDSGNIIAHTGSAPVVTPVTRRAVAQQQFTSANVITPSPTESSRPSMHPARAAEEAKGTPWANHY